MATKKSADELRAELMGDPRTASMAQTLGLTLEAYVEKVLDYALNPAKKPVFNVAPDAEIKAQGGATVQDVQQWLEQVKSGEVQIGPKGYSDGFDDPKKRP
jgi:hypothetical protein